MPAQSPREPSAPSMDITQYAQSIDKKSTTRVATQATHSKRNSNTRETPTNRSNEPGAPPPRRNKGRENPPSPGAGKDRQDTAQTRKRNETRDEARHGTGLHTHGKRGEQKRHNDELETWKDGVNFTHEIGRHLINANCDKIKCRTNE